MTSLLKVYANPFGQGTHCHDHLGRAHHRVLYEPDVVRGDAGLRWVGCRIVAVETKKADSVWKLKAEHDHSFEYSTEPATLAATAYYMRALQHHDLIAADVETYVYAFGTTEGFEDPKSRLRRLSDERECVPALQATEKVDQSKPRDRKAEWEAFVGPAPKTTSKPATSAKSGAQ